jgi:predicted MFS family arabinose efflux permease
MQGIGLKSRLVLFTLAILALSQIFNAGLTISSLEKMYIQGTLSRHRVAGGDMVRKIERSIRLGKPLERFVGMDRLFATLQLHAPSVIDCLVLLPDGTVTQAMNPDTTADSWTSYLDRQGRVTRIDGGEQGQTESFESSTSVFILLPITLKQESVGQLALVLSKQRIKDALREAVLSNITTLVATTSGAALILVFGMIFVVPTRADHPSFNARLYTILILAFGCAQIFYSLSNIVFFKNQSLSFLKHNSTTVISMVKQDIDKLLDKGVRLEQMHGVDTFFYDIIRVTPEIASISLTDNQDRPLFSADKQGPIPRGIDIHPRAANSEYNLDIAVQRPRSDTVEGHLRLSLSATVIDERIQTIVLDTLTVAVIAVLFLLEMLMLLSLILAIGKSARDKSHLAAGFKSALIRPVGFVVIFSMSLCFTFIPLRMGQLYEPMLGLSKEVIMGLPISMQMAGAGLAIVLAGFWIDRRGWHEPLILGLGAMSVGFSTAGMTADPLGYILALGLCGLGFGLAFMGSQGFVLKHADPARKASGLATFFAGVYAGNICGSAAGAMMADRLGYGPVFLISGILFLVTLALVLLFFRSLFETPARIPRSEMMPASASGIKTYIGNKNVFILLVFSIVPSALVLIGFINYALPVYLHLVGASQSDIGRIIMVYGICLVYLAPMISRLIERAKSRKPFVFLAGLLGAAAMGCYVFLDGLTAATCAVFFFGLSSSVGFASQNAYALNLKATHVFGENKAMGLCSATERIGQVLGPLVLGGLITLFGMDKAIVTAGMVYLLVTAIFFLLAGSDTASSPQQAPEQS